MGVGRRIQRVVGAVVAAVVVVAGLAVVAPPPPAAAGPVVDDLADRLLTVRPAVGPTWVLDVGGTNAQRLLARSLQGVVNRTEARLYLRDPGDGGSSQRWLDHYQAEGLVTVAGTTDLDGALTRFAGEVAGYVLVDEAEPWTVQVGITLAGLEGAVVATPAVAAVLDGHGLAPLHDLRGRWPDAATAYADAAATWRHLLPSDTVAVVRASDAAVDFAVQQGLFAVFARPPDPAWPAVVDVLADTPPGSPVYGYLSDTGDEEVEALAVLSAEDLVLVPTDTTRNLSYHVAVGADRARVRAPAPATAGVAPCTADTLNVVVGVTDGDNLNVPLNHFTNAANWGSPRRGSVPLGWSMSPALAALAPAAWDAYASQATPADELVAMAGWGYAAPSLLPDAAGFYRTTFDVMDELGLRSLWSLGGGLETPVAPAWSVLDAEAGAGGLPDVVLIGYGNGTGSQFWGPGGRPAMTSRSVYSETPAQIEGHVRDLLATPADQRPLVSFLSATNWSNPVDELLARLEPLTAEGVRFLTPSQAAACLPDAPVVDPPAPSGSSCAATAEPVSSGLGLIAAPVRAEMAARPADFGVPVAVTAPASARAGDVLDLRATLTVDVPAFAADVLTDRVRPVVEAGYGPVLADSAWVAMDVPWLTAVLELPDGVEPVGQPTVTSSGPAATARWTPDGIEVRTGPVAEDTRTPGQPVVVELAWSVRAEGAASDRLVEVVAGPVAFRLGLTVGVQVGVLTLTGTVAAPWACEVTTGVLAATAVAGVPAPPSSISTTVATSVPTTATTAPPPDRVVAADASPPAAPVEAAARYAG